LILGEGGNPVKHARQDCFTEKKAAVSERQPHVLHKYLCSADFFERDGRYYLPFAAFLAGFLAFLAMVFSVFRICP
jgi:hypothetical protein